MSLLKNSNVLHNKKCQIIFFPVGINITFVAVSWKQLEVTFEFHFGLSPSHSFIRKYNNNLGLKPEPSTVSGTIIWHKAHAGQAVISYHLRCSPPTPHHPEAAMQHWREVRFPPPLWGSWVGVTNKGKLDLALTPFCKCGPFHNHPTLHS